jgi:hypothetical protein
MRLTNRFGGIMHARTAAAVLLASAALLAGCSSSSSDDKASPSPTSTSPAVTTPATVQATTPTPTTSAGDDKAALVDAVRAYSAAFFKPDPASGWALLSKGCKDTTSRTAYAAELTAAVKVYGHQQVKTVTVDQIAGGLARVSYTYSVPTLDQNRQPWALEDGAWKYDGC